MKFEPPRSSDLHEASVRPRRAVTETEGAPMRGDPPLPQSPRMSAFAFPLSCPSALPSVHGLGEASQLSWLLAVRFGRTAARRGGRRDIPRRPGAPHRRAVAGAGGARQRGHFWRVSLPIESAVRGAGGRAPFGAHCRAGPRMSSWRVRLEVVADRRLTAKMGPTGRRRG